MSKPEVALDTLDEVFLTRSKIGKYFSIPDDKRNIMLQYFQKVRLFSFDNFKMYLFSFV